MAAMAKKYPEWRIKKNGRDALSLLETVIDFCLDNGAFTLSISLTINDKNSVTFETDEGEYYVRPVGKYHNVYKK